MSFARLSRRVGFLGECTASERAKTKCDGAAQASEERLGCFRKRAAVTWMEALMVMSSANYSMYSGMESTFWRHWWWNGGYFGAIFAVKGVLPKAEVGPQPDLLRVADGRPRKQSY